MIAMIPEIDENDILFIHAQTVALIARLTQICGRSSAGSQVIAKSKAYEDVFTKAVEIIESDISEKTDIMSIAKRLGVSKSTLYRVFGIFTGQGPGEFIVRKRLERAKHLIENTEDSVSGIAAECGFFDSSHLTRMMVRYLKTSPGKLRGLKPGMQ